MKYVGYTPNRSPKVMAITPERDVVFYNADGTERYRCPLDSLVDIIRTIAESS